MYTVKKDHITWENTRPQIKVVLPLSNFQKYEHFFRLNIILIFKAVDYALFINDYNILICV